MLKNGLEPWHIIVLVVLLIALFGWKRLPDAARSIGRSARIFKSEMSEMKTDATKPAPSPAAKDTVAGQVQDVPATTPPRATDVAADEAARVRAQIEGRDAGTR